MKISIVTPSFNQLQWLERATASVSDQGLAGVEIEHLVQDAGTPGVGNLSHNIPVRPHYDLQITVEKDDGMYDAINRGLQKASGEICAWLNCDEQYLPETLARVADYFGNHPEIDVVFGDALLVDKKGDALSYRRAVLPGPVHTRLVHLNTLSCSTFFRRSVVERGLLFETRWRMIGDAVWVYDMLKANVPMGLLPGPLAVFAFTGVNQSESERAKKESDLWRRAPDAPSPVLRWPAILGHRMRKFQGGAYQRRDVEYQIYGKNAEHRDNFSGRQLGWNWPKAVPSVSD